MTVSKRDPAKATAEQDARSPAAPNTTVRQDRRAGELAEQDLDKIAGGPTAVERNHTPT